MPFGIETERDWVLLVLKLFVRCCFPRGGTGQEDVLILICLIPSSLCACVWVEFVCVHGNQIISFLKWML